MEVKTTLDYWTMLYQNIILSVKSGFGKTTKCVFNQLVSSSTHNTSIGIGNNSIQYTSIRIAGQKAHLHLVGVTV